MPGKKREGVRVYGFTPHLDSVLVAEGDYQTRQRELPSHAEGFLWPRTYILHEIALLFIQEACPATASYGDLSVCRSDGWGRNSRRANLTLSRTYIHTYEGQKLHLSPRLFSTGLSLLAVGFAVASSNAQGCIGLSRGGVGSRMCVTRHKRLSGLIFCLRGRR